MQSSWRLATPGMPPPGVCRAVGRHVWVGFSKHERVGMAQQHDGGQRVGADRLCYRGEAAAPVAVSIPAPGWH